MIRWEFREVAFKYQLSDWVLFSVPLWLQCRSVPLLAEAESVELTVPTLRDLDAGSQGFMIRSLPIAAELPTLSRRGAFLCYAPSQYEHSYVDLSMGFELYERKFSSKTRSTIKRKIRKFSEHCGGEIVWRAYTEVSQVPEFLRLAREVSMLSYQERLLDAGMPNSRAFVHHAESLAAANCLRAYVLFDGERPVSYLYCPIVDGVVSYSYVGYDPQYMRFSVGTLLQWFAFRALFDEGCFKAFDFTEGSSEHKRLFATHSAKRANVYFIRPSLRNCLIVLSHLGANRFAEWAGRLLDRLGLRAKARRLIRFGRGSEPSAS